MALQSALSEVTSRLPSSADAPDAKPGRLPFLEPWVKGTPPDMTAICARLAAICQQVKPTAPRQPDASATDLIGVLCPALAELRTQNPMRPLCVLALDYDRQPPVHIPLSPITAFISLAKVLSYEERVALYEGNAQLALDDMAISRKIITGLQKQPLLISGLVAVGLSEIQLVVVQQGLADHVWTDAQLTQLDADLGNVDILSNGRFWIAGDVVFFNIPTAEYYQVHRWLSARELSAVQGKWEDADSDDPKYWARIVYWLTPKGRFDLDYADYARFELLGTVKAIDPSSRRVFPDRLAALLHSRVGVYSHVFTDQPFLDDVKSTTSSVESFAYGQVHLDEARIACRLERYRLAQGHYPDSLNQLVLAFGNKLPQDIMTGAPYRYRIQPDGTYLLYSVAWDQEDEDGQGPQKGQTPKDAPDWVWPSHADKK